MGKFLFLVAALVISVSAHAERKVYSCKDSNGTTVFSSQPCGQDAKEVNVDPRHGQPASEPANGTPSQPARPSDAIRDISNEAADNDCRRKARGAARYPSEEHLRGLERQEHDLEVRASYANNNLAGAVYENGVRKQLGDIQVSIEQERGRLTSERARIDQQYRDDIARCDQAKSEREQSR